jgi:D-alanine-D-alanine ligase
MDKDVTKRLLRDAGLAVAPFITDPRQPRAVQLCRCRSEAGLPLFVKPANQGSSVGVSKVKNEEQYHQAVALAFEFDHKVVVEQGIKGREIECAVLGNDHRRPAPAVKSSSTASFTPTTPNIDDQGAQVVVPAAIAPEINDKIRAIAVQAYQTLGCSGMARVDVFPPTTRW